ncbi:hypothetical protein M422DRAFT_775461 [Sphaerobolus stellatus SS14]|nr:hypothetical protein M422DRAFT_775461 [Sphaerobolus stellatus SS14]
MSWPYQEYSENYPVGPSREFTVFSEGTDYMSSNDNNQAHYLQVPPWPNSFHSTMHVFESTLQVPMLEYSGSSATSGSASPISPASSSLTSFENPLLDDTSSLPPPSPNLDQTLAQWQELPFAEHTFRRIPGTENSRVEAHLRKCPTDPKKLICASPNCRRSFFGRKELARNHVRKQHLKIEKLFKCTECSKEFTTYRAAKRHQETQLKFFSCRICNQTFARKDYQRKHQQKCEERIGMLNNASGEISLTIDPAIEYYDPRQFGTTLASTLGPPTGFSFDTNQCSYPPK